MWIVQVLSTTYTQVLANPTARQRVDRSSPFSSKAYTQILANPTARQRVDRSSPVYSKTYTQESESHITAACGSFKSFLQQDVHPRIRIPHHGSVWIVQVPSTASRTPRYSRIPQRGSVWIVQVLSKNGQPPYARESHSAAACGSFTSF